MAQLQSPGVSVTVIDESFYTPAAPGTVPLIIVASQENKQNGSNSGIAPGTLKANAGKVYLMTSQKDLSDTFGTPIFETDANNNPVHAGELNEYGLQAAYSFLGVSNTAYVARADINLAQLDKTPEIPAGLPANGTTWINTTDTQYGIFQWNSSPASTLGGQTFTVQKPLVITDNTLVDSQTDAPKNSIGSVGSYAIVATTSLISLWFKKPATTSASPVKWVEVGSTDWVSSWPAAQGTVLQSAITLIGSGQNADIFNINGTSINDVTTLTGLVNKINTGGAGSTPVVSGVTAAIINNKLQMYTTGANIVLSGSSVAKVGLTAGVYLAPALSIGPHTKIPEYKASSNPTTVSGNPSGSIWVKTTTVNAGAHWIVNRYNLTSKQWESLNVPIYANHAEALYSMDSVAGGNKLPLNSVYLKYNQTEQTVQQNSINYPKLADFKLFRRSAVGATTITSNAVTSNVFTAATYSFKFSETLVGSKLYSVEKTVNFITSNGDTAQTIADAIVEAINAAGLVNVVASVSSSNQIVIKHLAGGDITFTDLGNTPLAKLFSADTTLNYYRHEDSIDHSNVYIASNWTSETVSKSGLSFAIPSPTEPTSLTADGTLWYDSNINEVDILIHNGTTWVGYLSTSAQTMNQAGISNALPTDSLGPIISATEPTTQQDGVTALANGDLWISTADLENYPLIYKYDFTNKKWVLIDNSDQTTEHGILFHDARWTTGPETGTEGATPATIQSLLVSNFLDFDAPDPALYPKGMLLWNLRRSGFNVKKFVKNYVDNMDANPRYNNNELMTNYYPHRWISVAANQANGAGSFGRIAQREVVLQAMTSLINTNQQIRDEDRRVFNLLSAPGYPELIKPLVNLNYDRGLTAFVVGDTPARLHSDATTLSNWGSNANNALEDGSSGLVTTDPYLGVFYPWGYTTDNFGNNIVVPPSHMMLRTIALSDNVSYPWFAPAGVRRGGITNASSVGYITAEGEFESIALNNGQRDTLQNQNINPITYITGTGLVNYGQKTRQLVASSLDRINVARLVIYLRTQLERIAKPYIFEPNDTQTRNEIKQQIESFLLELVGQRALYDYLVVCDTSNNTPSRIDANELHVDIAIEPVKAVEYIYIPLRLENTGAIAKLGK